MEEKRYKVLDIPGLERTAAGYSDNGNLIADCLLGVRRISICDGDKETDEEYEVQIKILNKKFCERLSLSQIKSLRFLSGYGTGFEKNAKYYCLIRRALFQQVLSDEYISYETRRNGFQRVNHQWMFVYGRAGIDKSGYNPNVKSQCGGVYISERNVLKLPECIPYVKEIFNIYRQNVGVFYLIFLNDIMTLTNGYCDLVIGEETLMRIVTWLEGESGSGKTETARSGLFAFTSEDGRRRPVPKTANKKDVLLKLVQSSGSLYILDDVKEEVASQRKHDGKIVVDDVIRSVFQGFLESPAKGYQEYERIDCCAIITGEFLDTHKSQNARILYRNMDGFLDDRKNAEALRRLQEHPEWLSIVCNGYMQWLSARADDDNFNELVKTKIGEIRKESKIYEGFINATRLNETLSMVKLAEWMAGRFFHDIGMGKMFAKEFHENMDRCINEVMNSTYHVLEGGKMVLRKALEWVFRKAGIRKAAYRYSSGYSDLVYRQEYFWISSDQDDFVLIDDYGKSLETDTRKSRKYDGLTVCLIRQELFENLILEGMQNLGSMGVTVSSETTKKITKELWKMLMEMRIIYEVPRADSRYGRPMKQYPVFRIYISYDDFGVAYERDCIVRFENVVQVNIEHPYIEGLIEDMKEMDTENIFEAVGSWHILDADKNRAAVESFFMERKRFMSGKTLFRK